MTGRSSRRSAAELRRRRYQMQHMGTSNRDDSSDSENEQSTPSEDESTDPEIGSKAEVKALYSTSNPECDCAPRWSEYAEAAEEDRVLKRLGAASAIIQRFKRSSDRTWQTFSVEVQSPRLKTALTAVFKDHPEVAIRKREAAKFKAPFKPFFHRWQELLALEQDTEQDERTREEVSLLIETVKPTVDPYFSIANDMLRTEEVQFDHLWTIFMPGDLVAVRPCGGDVQVHRLHNLTLIDPGTPTKPRFWALTLHRIEWNGRYFGVVQRTGKIVEAKKPLLFEELPLLPLRIHRESDDIKARFLAKGKKYLSLCSYRGQVKTYDGTKFVLGPEMDVIRERPLSARIVVDPFAYFTCQSDIAPKQPRLNERGSDAFFSGDEKLFETAIDLKNEDEQEQSELAKIDSDKRLMCLVHRVKGFDLRNNDWCEFDVDSISDPCWNDEVLEKLVLSEGEKKLLLAFTRRNELDVPEFDDVIPDKGKGIIILLCGPPGVGKTLTAESVSERSRVPLYSLRASDLGTDSSHVETTLKSALECCKLWNAVLLIDEADVFMEKRSADRLEQNELVSIFLRNLEYFQGVMFLTTNRANSIDSAFRSRIDLILPYPDLTREARKQIWTTFLTSLPPEKCLMDGMEFDVLADSELNGRDIKNVVKIARFAAASENAPLTMQHLRTILDIKGRASAAMQNGL